MPFASLFTHHSFLRALHFFPPRMRRGATVFAPCMVHRPCNSLPFHGIRHYRLPRRAHPVRRELPRLADPPAHRRPMHTRRPLRRCRIQHCELRLHHPLLLLGKSRRKINPPIRPLGRRRQSCRRAGIMPCRRKINRGRTRCGLTRCLSHVGNVQNSPRVTRVSLCAIGAARTSLIAHSGNLRNFLRAMRRLLSGDANSLPHFTSLFTLRSSLFSRPPQPSPPALLLNFLLSRASAWHLLAPFSTSNGI
jgi:hypothetical protein